MMNNEILERFAYCPVCGSKHFDQQNFKSKKCQNCGFEYYTNPSAATAAFIINNEGQLLVLTRKKEPAKGTLDLPGGFADPGETAEEGVCREVMEETGLKVTSARYIFSQPNIYRFSGVDIPTLDMFFICEVEDESKLQAADDAAECMWVKLDDIHTEQFGLRSVRWGLIKFMESLKNNG